MHSNPPAQTMSSQPDAILAAAVLKVSKPLAQNRLSWAPGTDSSQPAFCSAILGSTAPCSITGVTQPSITSSTRPVSRSCRACISVSRVVTMLTGLTSCRLPSCFPLDRGVRIAS